MDYEKAYKEALERAIFVKENTDSIGARDVSDVIEYIFSELKESDEDEKIKDVAIEFVRQNKSFNYCLGISKEEVIEWLKSLKGRIKPQWKPREAQLAALEEVCKTHSANFACRRVISNLLNELKNL